MVQIHTGVPFIHTGIPFSHKKEILLFVTTWLDLVGLMLNEMSQTEKDNSSHVESKKTHRNRDQIGNS